MDQQISNELPPIYPEQDKSNQTGSPEQAAITEKQATQAAEQAVPAGLPPVPVFQQPVAAPPITPVAVPAAGMPAIADDADLIEKEWVMKAKEIVARTKHDPYQQNKEVERIKADYMKKRYNLEIKITEDS